MPRVSRQQTNANRAAIEDVSARLFRQQGIDGVSVAELMHAAGLTHGGFYGHYDSKDALAAAACTHAYAESSQRRAAWMEKAGAADDLRRRFIDRYLTPAHRDDPGHGCPAAALAVDVGRQAPDKPVRQAYAAGLDALADAVAAMSVPHDAANPTPQRAAALADLAALVGALVLARATQDTPLSGEILAAVRTALSSGPAVLPSQPASKDDRAS